MTEWSLNQFIASLPRVDEFPRLGQVILYHQLGKGGMGVVYKGKMIETEAEVAVKIMFPENVERSNDKLRFMREAELARKLNHPNLVRYIDIDEIDGVLFLIMEYLHGVPAGDYLTRNGNPGLPESEVINIMANISDGVKVLHQPPDTIVHRDIKPANILIADDRCVLMDLGLAKPFRSFDKDITSIGDIVGTPHFMSPEQYIDPANVGPPTDIWSLGVTLYYLAAGRLPWDHENVFELFQKIRNVHIPEVPLVKLDFSERFIDVVGACLKKDPDLRITAEELAVELKYMALTGLGHDGEKKNP